MLQASLFLDENRSAVISPCGTWRYQLGRSRARNRWPVIVWIMLNPSDADATRDDPTMQAVMAFSWACGFGHAWVVNLFAVRGSDPRVILKARDPVGPDNDKWIRETCAGAELAVMAWGNHGFAFGRNRAVEALLANSGIPRAHLGLTDSGHPRNPLYVKRTTELIRVPTGTLVKRE